MTRPMRNVLAALVFLFTLGLCRAQDLRSLSHQAWSTEEGLPQSSVHAIAQTKDGYLWVATEGGLARFDGVSFKVYGPTTFPSVDICCLKADDQGLLIGTGEGVWRESSGAFTRTAIAALQPKDSPGWTWSAESVRLMPHAGAEIGNDFEHSLVPKGFDPRSPRAKSDVRAAANGREWRSGEQLGGRVQSLLVDRNGLAWVGMRNGLAVIDATTGSVTEIPFLKGDSVLSVFEDLEGNHWIGTETSGLHILRRLKFRSVPGLAELGVTSVVQTSDGAMWIGTRDDGLQRVRDGVGAEPVPLARLTSGVILCMAPGPLGGLWVGTPDGLNFVGANGAVRKLSSADGLPDDYVRSLAVQGSSVWVGTQHGVAELKDGKVAQVLTVRAGLSGDQIGALLVTRDGLWVGTSGGLSTIGSLGKIRNFGAADGLTGQIITAMAGDKNGDVWVATKGGGVSLFDGRQFHPTGVFSPNAVIHGITADGRGNLWFRMDRGIRRLSVVDLLECANGGACPAKAQAIRYGLADGLPSDEEVASGSSGGWLASDGEMWFPTRRGVAVADTANLPIDRLAPPIVIERFSVDDATVENGAKIRYGPQRLTIDFAGLSYTAPGEVRYRVGLVGFDKDWVDAGAKRSATYTNLSPGPYTFQVQAMNGDGVWNQAGASVAFRIVPPYWRRWWFIAVLVLVVAALLISGYMLRLRRLQRGFDAVLAERSRMAREIHDTLTQDFVGTSVQLDIVAQMLKRGKTEAALEQVARTRKLVSEGLDEARQSIWELRANSSQDSLPTRVTRLSEREAYRGIGIELAIGGAYRELDARVEREVLRIAQEALNNVVRHAAATKTGVDLHYSDEALLLTIEDNGVGFGMDAVAKLDGHFGLVGMKERAAVIGAVLEVRSEMGKGSVVSLRVEV